MLLGASIVFFIAESKSLSEDEPSASKAAKSEKNRINVYIIFLLQARSNVEDDN